MANQPARWMLLWGYAAAIGLLPGCAAVAVTAAGVGMATGVSHTLGGIVYRTFAAPVLTTATGGKEGGGTSLTPLGIEVVKRYRRAEALALLVQKSWICGWRWLAHRSSIVPGTPVALSPPAPGPPPVYVRATCHLVQQQAQA